MLNSKKQIESTRNPRNNETEGNQIDILPLNKVDGLLTTIIEARKSLEEWQNRKADALMQLDALSYDIRVIEEERNRNRDRMTELKNELKNQTGVHQAHVDLMTDEMQMMKIEREDLLKQLEWAQIEIEKQKTEADLQRGSQIRIETLTANKIADIHAEYEVRLEEQQNEFKKQIAAMTEQLNEAVRGKKECEKRSDILENELQGVRSHMMSVLRMTDTVVSAPSAAASGMQHSDSKLGAKLRPAEVDHSPGVSGETTVAEYLKRFGY